MSDNFNVDDFDLDIPDDGGNVGFESNEDNPTPDETGEYPVIEEGDSKYVKIPYDEFETLKNGAMRQEDYTAKTQVVSSLTKKLQDTIAKLEGQQEDGEVNIPEYEDGIPIEDYEAKIEEIINERIQPIYEAQALKEIEEETKQFKEKYSFIFTGDKQKDDEIMSKLYLTAATYTKKDGSPLSLEEAFAIAYRDNLLGTTSELLQKEQERRKRWGSEEDSNMGAINPPIADEKDADMEFKKKLAELRGY